MDCVICYETTKKHVTSCCKQPIHKQCLARWFAQGNSVGVDTETCPNCRCQAPKLLRRKHITPSKGTKFGLKQRIAVFLHKYFYQDYEVYVNDVQQLRAIEEALRSVCGNA
jgi:hypothetical protein